MFVCGLNRGGWSGNGFGRGAAGRDGEESGIWKGRPSAPCAELVIGDRTIGESGAGTPAGCTGNLGTRTGGRHEDVATLRLRSGNPDGLRRWGRIAARG